MNRLKIDAEKAIPTTMGLSGVAMLVGIPAFLLGEFLEVGWLRWAGLMGILAFCGIWAIVIIVSLAGGAAFGVFDFLLSHVPPFRGRRVVFGVVCVLLFLAMLSVFFLGGDPDHGTGIKYRGMPVD